MAGPVGLTWAAFVNSMGPGSREALRRAVRQRKAGNPAAWNRIKQVYNQKRQTGGPDKPEKPLVRPDLRPDAYLANPDYLLESGDMTDTYTRGKSGIERGYANEIAGIASDESKLYQDFGQMRENMLGEMAGRGLVRSGTRDRALTYHNDDRQRAINQILLRRSNAGADRSNMLNQAESDYRVGSNRLRRNYQNEAAQTHQQRGYNFDDGSSAPKAAPKPVKPTFAVFKQKAGKNWTGQQLRNAYNRRYG
jgi:hypothetical protein